MSSQMPGGTSWRRGGRQVGAKYKRSPPVVFRRRPIPRAVTSALIGNRVHTFKRAGIPVHVGSILNDFDFKGNGIAPLSSSIVDPDVPGCRATGAALKFQLSYVTNPTEFTSLFDRYKVVGVKLQFLPGMNSADAYSLGAAAAPIPYLHYAQDWDDWSPPATESTILQKGTVKTRRLDRPFSIYIKPKVSQMVYHQGVTSAYASASPWIDSGNSDVEYYGLKLWFRNWMTDPGQQNNNLTIIPTYFLQMRDSI